MIFFAPPRMCTASYEGLLYYILYYSCMTWLVMRLLFLSGYVKVVFESGLADIGKWFTVSWE
jgi:hypothetical protein